MTGPATFLLDANVLLALASTQHVHHGAAHRWFGEVTAWATTPITETAFVRLVSNPAVVGAEVPPNQAVALLQRLCEWPGHRFIADDARLVGATIDRVAMIGHRQVTDFHLVALAARNSTMLATFDAKLSAALSDDDRRHLHLVAP
ncbi:ribonuclease VapC39 [Agromyces luteolus]|uniref:Ribonuclease VapC n=1 Tax=Agromyces luteolus TaxID=88373 RepID=A0A7C9HWV2_9MICO|nr:TA system VapC family ribonuclease toxin [Agromyces luteolus]MUN06080.1 PIN domain-containing protein [Agromyces luteolus]GLK28882.1 ribonuclease VapC39 [Agromyces luteolus]